MSITPAVRRHSADTLRRWYDGTGVPQLQLHEDDANGGWKRHARCGQWNPDAPDPELFFPLRADSEDTYAAQSFCAQCPVRRYCDREATWHGRAGVWGGIFRDDRRQVAALCITPGCLRYREPSKRLCRGCATDQAGNVADPALAVSADVEEVAAA